MRGMFDGKTDEEILVILNEVSSRHENGVTDLGNGLEEVICKECYGFGVRKWRFGYSTEDRPCAACGGRGYHIRRKKPVE